MKHIFMSILITNLLTLHSFGQTLYEPIDLARKIFNQDQVFKEIEQYYKGEYKGRPNGIDMPKDAILKFLQLDKNETAAVINMTILDSTGNGVDTYLHFEKDVIWKMSAFRTLALTGIIQEVKANLEQMTTQEIDEAIEKSKKHKKNDGGALFCSREEYNYILGNTRLLLDLDENIIRHFLVNRSEFERLKDLAADDLKTKKSDDMRRVKLISSLEQDYRKIFISGVTAGEFDNAINFEIGGMVDNTVGFIYLPPGNPLPQMTPNRLIMIREIGNGWYLYKTT